MTEEKKKTKRSQVKYPSLTRRFNSRVRQEYLDMDYLDELDDTVKNCKLPDGTMVTELEYMALFMKEYNNAGVTKQSEAHKNVFHRTAKETKDCTDRNNQRNADEYGRAKAHKLVYKVDPETIKDYIDREQDNGMNNVENSMVELLDGGEDHLAQIEKERQEWLESEEYQDYLKKTKELGKTRNNTNKKRNKAK